MKEIVEQDPFGLLSGYRSQAMTPARVASQCSCGKPDCVFRSGYLAPFRDHLARLHHVLVFAHSPGQLPDSSEHSWSAVTYHLQMAASLESLEADTGYVDLIGSTLMCSAAARYEDEHSRLASQYTAALVIFNFVWAAYEAAIKVGAAGFLAKEHTPFRGRALMARDEAAAREVPALSQLVQDAEAFVFHIGDLAPERAKVGRFASGTAEQASELVRLFRNHVAHGGDAPPVPDQSHVDCRAVRFYKLGRLLLLLIQIIAVQALVAADAVYEGRADDDDYDEEGAEGNDRPNGEQGLEWAPFERTTRNMLIHLHVNRVRV